jgi:hypothetical protein
VKNKDKITFVSTVPGLETIEECIPKPSKNFIPEWFKEIPSNRTDTVRVCPSFPDYFSLGYIMPMWTDTVLRVDQKGPFWSVMQNDYSWDFHGDNQFIDWCYPNLRGVEAQFVFKSESPWKIITPPGWSVLQLPLFYHFNKGFSVLPGILDTDIHHETNHQVMYHGDGEDVIIKAGDPFALYIPFKRSEKLKSEVRYQTKEDEHMFKAKHLDLNKHFRPNGAYRSLQRRRDKKAENKKRQWPWTKTQK